QVLDYITLVGCSLSIFSLLICLFVFFVILRNTGERVIIHQNLCLCLFLGEIILLAGLDSAKEGNTFVLSSLHPFTSFFSPHSSGCSWKESIFTSSLLRTYIYFITGYGIPATIVLLSVCGVNYVSIDGYTSEDL
ncbi:Latrophilin3like, partial [Caligus rogercresseyi]